MATQIQFRRGTKTQHNSFTGATGEVTVDTTNLSLHVHDGVTPGGFESAKVDLSNHSGVGVLTATTFSGNLTGNVTGTATSTTNIPNLTGDITSVNTTTTLATVNSNVGTFGSSTAIPSIAVNAKGLVTGISTSAITVGDGTLTLATSGTGLSGSQTFTANQSGNATFTVTSNATSANTVSTIVARDGSGGFIAGIITASAFFGDGSGLSGVSAGSTVADDTSTDETFFPLLTQQTSGTITDSKVSTTKLTFNPSTGTLNATELNSTSDINLKENIRPIEESLNKVLQINGVEFDWKDNQQSSMGVIAQEVEKVFPSLVRTAENKSVNYNGLIGVLIEAVKEQQKQINILKKRIGELEG